MKKYCSKCGHKLEIDDRFCENCGTPLFTKPDQYGSVTVSRLESGDMVFYRPPDDAPSETYAISPPTVSGCDNQASDIFKDLLPPIIETSADEWKTEADDDFEKLSGPEAPVPLFEEDLCPAKAQDNTGFDNSRIPEATPEELKTLKEFLYDNLDSDHPEEDEDYDDDDEDYEEEFLKNKKSADEDISVLGWVGIIFLLLIPALNLLLIFIWALGGCRKNAKKRLARAILIVILILALVGLVSATLLRDTISNALHSLLTRGDLPSEFALRIQEFIRKSAEFWGLGTALFPAA